MGFQFFFGDFLNFFNFAKPLSVFVSGCFCIDVHLYISRCYAVCHHTLQTLSPIHAILLLGLFPSSGVAGMVMNIITPLCPVQYGLLL